MKEKLSLSDQSIIKCLSSDYNIAVSRLIFLPIGADIDASLYKAETQDLSYFIKIKRGHRADIGAVIGVLLYDAAISQIIPLVKTIQGQLTRRIEDFTLIVYPFVEGQDGFVRNLTDNQWIAFGKALRQIHTIELPPSIQKQIRQETYSPKWREIVRTFMALEVEPVGDEITLKLWQFMKKNRSVIYRLLNRAEELGQKLQKESHRYVLCHSDMHGGNLLLVGNGDFYIVDWDDPIMAPKERDLMFIGGGVANVWNQPHEEALFYKGYGKVEVNTAILSYYRHERIVEDIAVYGQALLL